MKARCITNGIVLDYCHVSEPLTFEHISEDINVIRAGTFRGPSEIVIWEHQWNWLVEQCQPRTPIAKKAFVGLAIGQSLAQFKIRLPNSIFGIPVRLAN